MTRGRSEVAHAALRMNPKLLREAPISMNRRPRRKYGTARVGFRFMRRPHELPGRRCAEAGGRI